METESKKESMVKSPQLNIKRKRGKMYRLRLVNGTWYSNFRHKGKKIQKALKAKGGTIENPPLEVHEELGALVRDVRLGLMPGAHNKKINQIVFKKKLKERSEQILRGKIFPFFGEYNLEDINEELIEKYFIFRWGRSLDGNLQAVQNTCLKDSNWIRLQKSPAPKACRRLFRRGT